jgi:type IV pilus assembly protein PilX
LLVLTLIGITVMQVSRMQERMAGNARDLATAFEAAEGALRNAELLVRQQSQEPAECTASPCSFWSQGSFNATAPLGGVESLSKDWWDANATPFNKDSPDHIMPGVNNPSTRYLIEDSGFVRTDGGVAVGIDLAAGRQFYQISARSTGASGLADTVVQSTYARKF